MQTLQPLIFAFRLLSTDVDLPFPDNECGHYCSGSNREGAHKNKIHAQQWMLFSTVLNVLDSCYTHVSKRTRDIPADSDSSPPAYGLLSSLPEEIILQIIESSCYGEDLDPDLPFLCTCALISKRWTAPSQSLLFRHVFLRKSSSLASFRSAVDPTTIRGKILRHYVVRLQIVQDYNQQGQLSLQALATAFYSCPNLYELDLVVFGRGLSATSNASATGVRDFRAAPSFDSDTLDLLRSGPAIRSLKLANWSDNDQLAFQLLSNVSPSLTAVSLTGTAPCLPVCDSCPILPFDCELNELRIGFQSTSNSEFMSWLLQRSSRTLRHLELERDLETDFLLSLARKYGPSLDSIALPSCSSRDHVAIIRECQNLKEFRFETSNVSPLLLKQLPMTVDHVAFSATKETPVYLITNFVKARRQLKAVTLHVWDGAESHPQLPNLRIECTINGVELLVVRGIRRFREVVRGDPVPCSSYPRFKAPGNLHKMLRISEQTRNDVALRSPPGPRAEFAAAKFARPVSTLPEFAAVNRPADGRHGKF